MLNPLSSLFIYMVENESESKAGLACMDSEDSSIDEMCDERRQTVQKKR